MNNSTSGNSLQSAIFLARIKQVCDEAYASEAKRLGLSDLHRKLAAGRGESYIRNRMATVGDGVEAISDVYEMVRSSALMIAAQFHDLEQLEVGWEETTYPNMDIMLFVWARAKRGGTVGLRTCNYLRNEFRARNEAIARVIIVHLLRWIDAVEFTDSVIGAFAKEIALRVSDYVEMLLEELPPVAVDFQEPTSGLEALDMFDEGIGPIPDEDLPTLPCEICAFDYAEGYMRTVLLRAGQPITGSEIIDLESLKPIGKYVAKYGFIALGLSLH